MKIHGSLWNYSTNMLQNDNLVMNFDAYIQFIRKLYIDI